MLSSVNRDHWNERLNFTGGAMILKPFPLVVMLIILLFLDSKEWLSKPRIKTLKRKERTWQIPTAKPSWADAWSIAHILGWKLSNTVRPLSMELKKNGKKKLSISGNTLAPFTRIRCYLKTKIFCCCLIWYVLFCFLRFGLSMTTVYPVTTVTENASYQNATQSGDLNTFASRLRAVDGRKRRFSNTMKSYIIYHENYACSVRDVFVFPSFFKF